MGGLMRFLFNGMHNVIAGGGEEKKEKARE